VQLSTFANAANAVALRDALRGRGFTAFIESATVGGKKVTRVYVGPELVQANATAAQKRLERDLGIRGLVVRYPGGTAAAP
jgi:DedD protein